MPTKVVAWAKTGNSSIPHTELNSCVDVHVSEIFRLLSAEVIVAGSTLAGLIKADDRPTICAKSNANSGIDERRGEDLATAIFETIFTARFCRLTDSPEAGMYGSALGSSSSVLKSEAREI